MADDSLPYLGDITMTQTLPSDGSTVPVAITWTVKSIRPSVIEVYAVFAGAGSLLNNLLDTVATSVSPITVHVPNANHNPTLYVGLAPRNLEADGVTKTDDMVDATGEPQKWETFVTEGKVNVTYTTQPPTTLSPPNIAVQSFVKTLHTNDYLSVTVSGPNANDYHLIVNSGGSDGAQMEKSDGNFPPIPSIPGQAYSLRAQQYVKGVNDGTDPWSPFSKPTVVIANARKRSVKTFLSISGVLTSGTGVRQFVGGSTRGMMGL